MTKRTSYNLPDFQWTNHRPIIEVAGLEKVFKTPAGPARVLMDIHLRVAAGEFVSIVGRSGSGKSTLINMLTGIDHPTAGMVRVGDNVLESMPEGKMAEWRGKTLGIVFQFFQLLPTLTLRENILLPMDFCRMYSPDERLKRADYLLDLVGLSDVADTLPGAISGGQQQSAAVARALSNDPPILVADEPTGNLDSASAEGVLTLFENLVGQGKTILMVTHDRNLASRASRSVLLSDGEMVDGWVAQAFAGLLDEKLLLLSRIGQVEKYLEGVVIFSRAADRPTDILIVRKGSLKLQNCSDPALENGLTDKIIPGQWMDLRRFFDLCPAAQISADAAEGVEIMRFPGADFDRIAGIQFQFIEPGGQV